MLKPLSPDIDLLIWMGRLSEAVFGRGKLPERCLIFAGAYLPTRKEWVRGLFDKWQRIKGQWVKFSFARRYEGEYFLVFNVYGASMILEIIQLLREGEAKRVFFIGSLGGKDLPVGTLVLPTRIVDKTGFVSLDTPGKLIAEPEEHNVNRLKEVLKSHGQAYVEGEIASVPCVLHDVKLIKDSVEQESRILGVECETSTFFHYARKASLESYALLYVSDNRKHDVISGSEGLWEARRRALTTITRIATEVLK
jgi:purine-nucleoside phosphorylase